MQLDRHDLSHGGGSALTEGETRPTRPEERNAHPRRLLHPERGSENSRLNQNGWAALATRTVTGLQNAMAFMLGAAFAACKAVARRFGGIMTALTGICCAAYGLQLTAALTTRVVVGMQGVTTIIHLLM